MRYFLNLSDHTTPFVRGEHLWVLPFYATVRELKRLVVSIAKTMAGL